ncbi:MAG: tetratricopeptide repeat protein [Parachlamydiales bacterium]
MLYLIFLFVTALLAALAFFEWRRTRLPQGKRLMKKRLRVAQHLALEEWEAAEQLLLVLMEKRPEDANLLLLQVQLLAATQRRERALEVADEALALDPHSLALMKEKGKLLLGMGRTAEALKLLSQAAPLLRDEEDLLQLATAQFLQERPDEALETLEPVLQGSERGPLLALAGDCLLAKGEKKAALCLYERAQRSGLYNASITARKGHCLKSLGRFKEAIRSFTEILQRDPHNLSALISLAGCYEAKGQYGTALLVYKQSPSWEGGSVQLLKAAGICAAYAGRYEEAVELLRSACLKGDRSSKTLVFLGYSYECQQQWEEAEAVYLQVTADHPRHPAGYRGLAWLFGVGRSRTLTIEEGLDMATRSLQLLPDPISWEVMSACAARAGNFEEAHQILEGLAVGEEDKAQLVRRQAAMRTLRRNLPLDEHLVARTLVA